MTVCDHVLREVWSDFGFESGDIVLIDSRLPCFGGTWADFELDSDEIEKRFDLKLAGAITQHHAREDPIELGDRELSRFKFVSAGDIEEQSGTVVLTGAQSLRLLTIYRMKSFITML